MSQNVVTSPQIASKKHLIFTRLISNGFVSYSIVSGRFHVRNQAIPLQACFWEILPLRVNRGTPSSTI